MLQVFAQCSGNDRTRLQFDPIFNSFVEDCMYDKSLGPGFEPSAKATLDAFVMWTESLMRLNRLAQQQSSFLMSSAMCAACIPVQWTSPIQSGLVLTPSVTARRGQFGVPTRYNGQNNYMLQPLINMFSAVNQLQSAATWNSQITLPSLSSTQLMTLPQQLMSAPIIITDDSHGIDTVSWNPMPSATGGICSLFDPTQTNRMEQIVSTYAQSGQMTQMAQMIRQGQMYSICYAVACNVASQSTSPSLSTLASLLTPQDIQLGCPVAQQSNPFAGQYGQFLGQNSAMFGQNPAQQLFGQSSGQQMFPGQNQFNGQQMFGPNGQPLMGPNGQQMFGQGNQAFGNPAMVNGQLMPGQFPAMQNGFNANPLNQGQFMPMQNNLANTNSFQNGVNGAGTSSSQVLAQQNGVNAMPQQQQQQQQQQGAVNPFL
jgi:hypothetical protein